MAMTLGKWLDIAPDYKDTLVLGNGASIAIHDAFNYKSLLEKARAESLITKPVDTIFKEMKTRDFELVLRYISIAEYVNRALGINDSKIHTAYEHVRKALIETVQKVHPRYQTAEPHLKPAYEFMARFKTVISLNYDLVAYWAMMLGNEALRSQGYDQFKDCFSDGGHFSTRCLYNELRKKRSTVVLYPHGNLSLADDPESGEFKIASNKNNGTPLLEQIIKEWRRDFCIPLFVAEGDKNQKLKAIRGSGYLSTVYDELSSHKGTLAIYGWSLGDNDEHILERLCKDKSKIAVSVYRSGGSSGPKSLCHSVRMKIHKFNEKVEIEFYDAESPGCWISPQVPVALAAQ
ncbi:MAG: DUF4917 family protein [Sedimentisphaerales bacterium]|nr:DUF4917 family protein [Sedimentisphaerales bacterium]